MIYDYIILGSGLSSLAALSEIGSKKNILVLDYGITHNKNINIKKVDFNKIHQNKHKTYWGSNFATRKVKENDYTFNSINNSYAYGGLSNIWGAAIELPSIKFFDYLNLNEDYKHSIKKTRFLLKPVNSLSLSNDKIFKKLYKDLKESLDSDFKINISKLAINKKKCDLSNLCLYGCLNHAIFKASDVFENYLKKNKYSLIHYKSQMFINKFKEYKNYVQIECIHNKKKSTYKAKRVICGLGGFNTPKLLIRSNINIRKLFIKDSSYFITSIFSFSSLIKNNFNNNIALSKFNIKNKIDKNNVVHYQFYNSSPFIYNYLKYETFFKKLSFIPFIDKFLFLLSKHLILVQGFLPSDYSAKIKLEYIRNKIHYIEYITSSYHLILYLLKKLSIQLKKNNLFLFPSLTKFMKPLSGYHFGASLPMSNFLSKNNTDIYGRPYGLKRFHIVDSTVLPNIPAGSFTSYVIVNSIRIIRSIYKDKL